MNRLVVQQKFSTKPTDWNLAQKAPRSCFQTPPSVAPRHLGSLFTRPRTGVDSNAEANVFSTVIELPTSELNPKTEIHIWGGAV
jgi:hypothetical protein